MWRNGMAVRMPNHLGDARDGAAALGQLRKIIPPRCALYCIAPAGQRALYHSLPVVDGIVPLERIHSGWSREELMLLRRLRLGVGVLFNNSFRDALSMRLAGVPNLYGGESALPFISAAARIRVSAAAGAGAGKHSPCQPLSGHRVGARRSGLGRRPAGIPAFARSRRTAGRRSPRSASTRSC